MLKKVEALKKLEEIVDYVAATYTGEEQVTMLNKLMDLTEVISNGK
jgi:hypothetical protein